MDLSLMPRRRALKTDITDLDQIERNAIERVLRDVIGNKMEAARKLGISPTQLYAYLRKYGLGECQTVERSRQGPLN